MGKASRAKRRAPVRAAKKAKTNTIWYAMTAVIVVVGVVLIVISRPDGPGVGPIVARGDHWHASLGVYVCDHWATDTNPDPASGQVPAEGTWIWPGLTTNSQGDPVIGRVGTTVYAGLHSHVDGIIHMEPQVTEDAGKNATVGRYFKYGGWKVNETSFQFLSEQKKNGDTCGDGKPGTLQWEVNGEKMSGNPSSYKLFNDDRVTIAFIPDDKKLEDVGEAPSVKNLAGAEGRETNSPEVTDTTLPSDLTIPGTETTVPGTPTPDAGTETTLDPASATTTPGPPTSTP